MVPSLLTANIAPKSPPPPPPEMVTYKEIRTTETSLLNPIVARLARISGEDGWNHSKIRPKRQNSPPRLRIRAKMLEQSISNRGNKAKTPVRQHLKMRCDGANYAMRPCRSIVSSVDRLRYQCATRSEASLFVQDRFETLTHFAISSTRSKQQRKCFLGRYAFQVAQVHASQPLTKNGAWQMMVGIALGSSAQQR